MYNVTDWLGGLVDGYTDYCDITDNNLPFQLRRTLHLHHYYNVHKTKKMQTLKQTKTKLGTHTMLENEMHVRVLSRKSTNESSF